MQFAQVVDSQFSDLNINAFDVSLVFEKFYSIKNNGLDLVTHCVPFKELTSFQNLIDEVYRLNVCLKSCLLAVFFIKIKFKIFETRFD